MPISEPVRMDTQLREAKEALRREMLARRDALSSRERVRAAMTIAARPVPS